jgi:PST family polysaccharide transporter
MKKNQELTTLQRLSENFISLVVLQFINYLLPLFLIPYLIHVLGIEGFGIYSFVLAIMMYGVQMSDYGFELSATYHISLHREDKNKINEIFSSVLTIKLLIALAYLSMLTLLILFVDKLFLYKELLFLSFGMIFGHLMFPLWFFQGIEKMRYIMYLNSFSKLLFFLSVFIFVTKENDLYLLMIFNSISSLLIGVIALYVAVNKFDITLSFQPFNRLLYYLKDGWYIFTSKFAVEFYTTANIIILGFFATPMVIGYYAVSIKIIHALGSLLDPLTRTVYPYLVNLYQDSNENFITRNKQLSGVIFLIMFPVALLVIYFSEPILELITGKDVALLNIEILQVFSISLMVYLYGSQFTNMLVTIKETKFLNQILFLTAGINVVFAPIFVYFYGVMGMVWLSVSIAFFLTMGKGYYLFVRLKGKHTKR